MLTACAATIIVDAGRRMRVTVAIRTSFLLSISLLVCAASLASYLLSQWISIRNNGRTVSWLGIGIGATLMLAAAVVVVLCVSSLSTHWLPGDGSLLERMIKRAKFAGAVAESNGEETSGSLQAPSNAVERPSSRNTAERIDRNASAYGDESEPPTTAASSRPQQDARATATNATSRGSGVGASLANSWAATRCVLSLHLDPADPTRWSLENECGSPVGIVFASCTQSTEECNARESMSWKYQFDGLILPAKVQRPVSEAEQTRYGPQIRYAACIVTNPVAIRLIGADSETRSSQAWFEQFEAAREQDGCLTRVRSLSEAGSRSGVSIDILLGLGLSDNAHRPKR